MRFSALAICIPAFFTALACDGPTPSGEGEGDVGEGEGEGDVGEGDGEGDSGVETSYDGVDLPTFMEAFWQQKLTATGPTVFHERQFVPLPDGVDDGTGTFVGTGAFGLDATTGFVLPLFVYLGEGYVDPAMMVDDRDFPSRDTFINIDLDLTLDGETIITGDGVDLDPYYFDATDLNPVVNYPMPSATGANRVVWVKGTGMLHAPLSAGTHTLHLVESIAEFSLGFDNTWTITVQ
jgi:hypothetical protein